ncbi:hypothetical protein, partial [Bacteroides heparinolyticus]
RAAWDDNGRTYFFLKPEARRRVGHGELLPPHFIGRNTALHRSQYLTSSVVIPHFTDFNPALCWL